MLGSGLEPATPTVQLPHCQTSAAEGGDTILADGFAAAAHLRAHDYADLDALASSLAVLGRQEVAA
jgi:alpha-ketoglutarate-dependent taurine dioxygenase